MSPPPDKFILPFYEFFETFWEDGRAYNYQQAQVYFHLVIVGGFILPVLVLATGLALLLLCTTSCSYRRKLKRGVHVLLSLLLTTTIAALIATAVGASGVDPIPQFIITLFSLLCFTSLAWYLYILSSEWWFGRTGLAREARRRARVEQRKSIPLRQYSTSAAEVRKRTGPDQPDEYVFSLDDTASVGYASPYATPTVPPQTRASAVVLVALCILAYSIAFNGICISFMPMHWSSTLTRITQPRICERNSVCHVYFTTTTRPDASIRVHFHASYPLSRPTVRYTSIGPGISNITNGNTDHVRPSVKKLENAYVDRWIYTVVIEQLQPNTTYYVYVGESGSVGRERKIRTFPALGTSNDYRFVAGGDIGTTEAAKKLLADAARKEPLFFLAGGDLAYANSICACYYVWDQFFHNLDTLFVTPTGYSIPIFSVVGNHDVGGYDRSREEVKFYYDYFPTDTNQSYHGMRFSNTSIIGIDSDFQVPLAGTQEDWTVSELTYGSESASFVAYHLPLFPTKRSY